jgi:hypothetical protein
MLSHVIYSDLQSERVGNLGRNITDDFICSFGQNNFASLLLLCVFCSTISTASVAAILHLDDAPILV